MQENYLKNKSVLPGEIEDFKSLQIRIWKGFGPLTLTTNHNKLEEVRETKKRDH